MSSSPIDCRKTTGWRLGNNSNTILGEVYEKQGEVLDEWTKHERRPYLRGKVVDFLGRDFRFWGKSQLSGQTKHRLCTKCSDHVARRAGPAQPETEDFFSGTGHTYPHMNEIHVPGLGGKILDILLHYSNLQFLFCSKSFNWDDCPQVLLWYLPCLCMH